MKIKAALAIAMGAAVLVWLSTLQPPPCSTCIVMPDFDLTKMRPTESIPSPQVSLPYASPPAAGSWLSLNPTERMANARARLLPQLHTELAAKNAKLGTPAFLRVLKEEHEMELWLRTTAGSDWTLFRTYPIAAYSGALGPKQREGDGQAPEGVYAVTKAQLNPASSYHLSFNIGYPNAYDLYHQRTGSHIMIHGSNMSVGCFAMTDPVIEEIYLIVEAALNAGQTQVAVHVFPFRMTSARMAGTESHPWRAFWEELLPLYSAFETTHEPPVISVRDGRYQIAAQ